MIWWPWLIVVGVILVVTIIMLVVIIITSNKLALLKTAVDRNYPVINSKIRQYCEHVKNLVEFSNKKLKKSSKSGEKLLNDVKDCLETSQMVDRAVKQRNVAESTKKFVTSLKRKEEFKNSRKINETVKELDELEVDLFTAINKYNDCVDKYNKKRSSFPANLISTRFKFAERRSWKFD